jgi:hypothetical protein
MWHHLVDRIRALELGTSGVGSDSLSQKGGVFMLPGEPELRILSQPRSLIYVSTGITVGLALTVNAELDLLIQPCFNVEVRSWYKGSDVPHIKHHHHNYRAEYLEQSNISNHPISRTIQYLEQSNISINHSIIQDAAFEHLCFCYLPGQHFGYPPGQHFGYPPGQHFGYDAW